MKTGQNHINECRRAATIVFLSCLLFSVVMQDVRGQLRFQQVFFYGAGGISCLRSSLDGGLKQNISAGGHIGAGYRYFANYGVSFSIAAEMTLVGNRLSAAQINDSIVGMTDVYDPSKPFTFRYTMNRFNERQSIYMLTIPLMIHYGFGHRQRFSVALGGKAGFPVFARYNAGTAAFKTSAYYPDADVEFDTPESWGFGNFTTSSNGRLSVKPAYFFAFQIGADWPIANGWFLYTGLYLDYGLNTINRPNKTNTRPFSGTPGVPLTDGQKYYGHNSMLNASNSAGRAYAGHTTPLLAGVKVQIAFGNVSRSNSRVPLDAPRVAEADKAYHKKDLERRPIDKVINLITGNTNQKTTVASVTNEQTQKPTKPAPEYKQPDASEIVDFEFSITGFGVSGSSLSTDSKTELDKKVAFLKKYPNLKIVITGYTDSSGKPETNIWVGRQRALAARNYLVSHGVDGSRINIASKGDTDPIAPNDTEENRSKNRRVKLEIRQQ